MYFYIREYFSIVHTCFVNKPYNPEMNYTLVIAHNFDIYFAFTALKIEYNATSRKLGALANTEYWTS